MKVSEGAPVIVVGAGPAGATAARVLASAGRPVRLLDRATFPRNKPCGGGISTRVLKRFPYLAQELSSIATHQVSRLHLEGPDGTSTVVESPTPAALMVRRVEFDALLVSLAVRAGATLVPDADIVQASCDRDRVTLTARNGKRFDAPLVIAADGVHSVVARRLGLRREWPPGGVALDMMEETPRSLLRDLNPSTMWVAYGYEAADRGAPAARKGASEGYAYIFPKRDHVNVGVGYLLSYFREEVDRAPYDIQRSLVDSLRDRGVMVGESQRQHFTPYLIPVDGPMPAPGRGRVLVAGDAGGFVNAFTAEGIYYAMVSGDLAARAILETPDRPQGNRLARRYRRACDREIGAELSDSVLIQRYLFRDRRNTARIIRETPKHPGITEAILQYAIGSRSYRSLRRRLLLRFPGLAARLAWERFRSI